MRYMPHALTSYHTVFSHLPIYRIKTKTERYSLCQRCTSSIFYFASFRVWLFVLASCSSFHENVFDFIYGMCGVVWYGATHFASTAWKLTASCIQTNSTYTQAIPDFQRERKKKRTGRSSRRNRTADTRKGPSERKKKKNWRTRKSQKYKTEDVF